MVCGSNAQDDSDDRPGTLIRPFSAKVSSSASPSCLGSFGPKCGDCATLWVRECWTKELCMWLNVEICIFSLVWEKLSPLKRKIVRAFIQANHSASTTLAPVILIQVVTARRALLAHRKDTFQVYSFTAVLI